ncbi:UDP-glycosyltransferase 73B4 [Striga hermonthica]|uniref:UDP-glycosyltransferase 73B4 n=1 Tax=Striga hermonthica TaxID=68872 RepID=A0A9N7R448_STRHE|nr:UDP-glycosyltransferase 73B4 [Striga hermonthica]
MVAMVLKASSSDRSAFEPRFCHLPSDEVMESPATPPLGIDMTVESPPSARSGFDGPPTRTGSVSPDSLVKFRHSNFSSMAWDSSTRPHSEHVEQIFEIARGLERSECKFLWVLRDADKGDVFAGEVRRAPLPQGFEEKVKGRGLIVRDWAPQLEILGHPSVGGFISHCGWNSCMESMSLGVPIIAWPMHSDQPRNAVLTTNVLKIGIQITDWERLHEIVKSGAIEKAVKMLMASEEGDEIRKRAERLGIAVRESLKEGGATAKEMDSFIEDMKK